MLRQLMHHWERKLYQRDTNRIVRPFEWGLEFLDANYAADRDERHARELIARFNEKVLTASEDFFKPPSTSDFDFDGHGLRFPSAIETPYPSNNTVHARYFSSHSSGVDECAVIVMPQWNADAEGHVALCRLLARFGIGALRLTLPYHDQRKPAQLDRAEYMVSSNIGRTIQAVRQAVLDVRRAADWLITRGTKHVGVMGTSVGSCVAFLTFAHDERLEAGVFNHVSSYFGEVLWDGITTSHVRRGLETKLTREEARHIWLTISPSAYVHRLREQQRHALLLSARYDLTFPPELSQVLFEDCARHNVPIRKVLLPCGHYSSGKTPFKYLVAWHIVNFFRRAWRSREPKGIIQHA